MAVQHSAIPDAQLHEPKGVVSASTGQAYIADGLGSGDWVKVQKAQGACLKASSTGATTGITTAYQAINNATLGGTIAWATNNNEGFTINTTSGYIQVAEAGMYNVTYTASFIPATNGSSFQFTFGIDSGGGIVSKETYVACRIDTSGSTDSVIATFSCLPTVAANDKLYVMVKETTAGEELTLLYSNFVVVRVA
jgi:hypothetical protein